MKPYTTNKAVRGDVIKIKGKRSKYLVIRTEMEGGGSGHGPYDVYPDVYTVYSFPLKKDGQPDMKKKFKFTMLNNCFNDCIDTVEVVGKMRCIVRWVKEK